MKKEKPVWMDVMNPVIIDRTESSQIRLSVIQMKGADEIHIALREFAKYIRADEKGMNYRVEDMPFRATANGLTFKVEKLEEVIEVLQSFRYELIK